MRSDDWRARVTTEARSWIGTPYHHLGDIKGAGVDCAMLVWRIYHDLGLIDVPDPRPYPVEWHLHRSEERYLAQLEQFAQPVSAPQLGDIVMFRYGRTVSHSAILTSPTTIVHAYIGLGCWEEDLATYADRLHSYWSISK